MPTRRWAYAIARGGVLTVSTPTAAKTMSNAEVTCPGTVQKPQPVDMIIEVARKVAAVWATHCPLGQR